MLDFLYIRGGISEYDKPAAHNKNVFCIRFSMNYRALLNAVSWERTPISSSCRTSHVHADSVQARARPLRRPHRVRATF